MSIALDAPIPAESLDDWRPRAAQATFLAALVAFTPGFVVVLVRDEEPALRMVYLAFEAILLMTVLLPRRLHRAKVALSVGLGFAVAALALYRVGAAGMGRSALFSLPMLALLLVGRRAGAWVLLGTVALLALFVGLAFAGRLPPPIPQVSGPDWLFQAFGTAVLMVPCGVLLERALRFQEGALSRAREARARLVAEAEERRRLEAELLEASERERRLVGHELHDGLCQQLTAGLLATRLLERTLRARGAAEAEQSSALAEVLETALGEARSLARGLSPGPLSPGGLAGALRGLARQLRESFEVDCDVTGPGAPSVGGAEAAQLYRIAQEATQNAARHAGANRITIDLSEDEAGVTLSIRDDGRGIGAEVVPGVGLRSMKGRAVALGGTLEISPVPGGGTQVACRVPGRRSPR